MRGEGPLQNLAFPGLAIGFWYVKELCGGEIWDLNHNYQWISPGESPAVCLAKEAKIIVIKLPIVAPCPLPHP
jgi:hypothetical protein